MYSNAVVINLTRHHYRNRKLIEIEQSRNIPKHTMEYVGIYSMRKVIYQISKLFGEKQ